jgi:hypothetical protein
MKFFDEALQVRQEHNIEVLGFPMNKNKSLSSCHRAGQSQRILSLQDKINHLWF